MGEPGDHATNEGEEEELGGPGFHNPEMVDLISRDPKTDSYCLVMVQSREWDGSRKILLEIQEKINAYLAFILEGELAKRIPEAVGRPIRIELHCDDPPDPATVSLLERARDLLREQGFSFSWLVR